MNSAMSYPRLQSGSDFYIAINAEKIPPVPSLGSDFSPTNLMDLRSIRNAVDAFPQLPFVLCDPPFTSQLLGILSNPHVRKKGDGHFQLDTKVAKRWAELEETLVKCGMHICDFVRSHQVQFPNGFDIAKEAFLPRAFNYGGDFRNKDESRLAIKSSLYAFQLLAAGISFAIAHASQRNDNPRHPAWAVHLQDVTAFDPVFVDRLKSSPLCDRSARHVGAFIPRGTNSSWTRHILAMESFNCPIFIHWNDNGWWDISVYRELEKYRPPSPHGPVPFSSSSRPTHSNNTGYQGPPPLRNSHPATSRSYRPSESSSTRPSTNAPSPSLSWGSTSLSTSSARTSSWGGSPSAPSPWGGQSPTGGWSSASSTDSWSSHKGPPTSSSWGNESSTLSSSADKSEASSSWGDISSTDSWCSSKGPQHCLHRVMCPQCHSH
jgi:hypothetical protein